MNELDLDLDETEKEDDEELGIGMPAGFSFGADEDAEDSADEDEGQEEEEEEAPAEVDINLVMDVPVTMQVVLGSATMTVANLLKLGRGAVVKLDTKVGDPVDVVVNGRIVARGEIVVIDKEEQRFGVTLTEIAKPGARLQSRRSRAA
ncbi:flagellar motor switch protein FliN [Aurantimonas sp. VKM B-3413]|uniref:flagellar motor switch protein FliN n=1 Tax=Aurantimonas sp. VKM B-3413 TaxID=2779401 RepID=UPI001E38ECB8|nr:flagellar motor switch protein FliN [Aurantimonas sp. VKM B-3413]MCB8837934.1 flagellar motor switch protein FliN [Aurantimonas sp. VKM B-3413]